MTRPNPSRVTPVGRRLRRAREDRGWTQSELARRANVDPSSVSRVERGEIAAPSGEFLSQVALVLNLPVDTLLHGAQQPTEPTSPRWSGQSTPN